MREARPAFVWLAAAAALAGCMTPHVNPRPSQAVLEARARREAPPPPACPETPLSDVSPVMLGFGFDESEFTEALARRLAEPVRWLVCHPAIPVLIRPDADAHGTEAEQDALARARADAVRDHLTRGGVAADRIRILARGGEAEPGGDVFLVRAEGRRW